MNLKLAVLTLFLLLVACTTTPACPAGQVEIDGVCCTDENQNGVCDRDDPVPEPEEPAAEIVLDLEPEADTSVTINPPE